jgi:multidrug efflux pump
VTLSVTILISAIVSLTLTPMMAARILRHKPESEQSGFYRWTENLFNRIIDAYGRSLRWVLQYETIALLVAAATLILTVYLYIEIPKGFFPVQDTGIIQGVSQAPDSISFSAMSEKQQQLSKVVLQDPAVASLSSFIGADGTNTTLNSGRFQINLKPIKVRHLDASAVIRRLQANLDRKVPGIHLYLQPVQDLTVDDRVSRTQYQYTLEDPDPAELNLWTARLVDALHKVPQITDIATDQQSNGVTAQLTIDRATASRLNITPDQIDSTLYDAFGQRQISTLYTQSNQYHVILETSPEFQQDPGKLNDIYIQDETMTAASSTSTSGRTAGGPTGAVATLSPSSNSGSSSTQNSALTASSGSSSASSTNGTALSTVSTGASTSSANLSSSTPTSGLATSSAASSGSSNGSTSNGSSNQSNAQGQVSSSATPTPVPLGAFSHFELKPSPLTVAHQGQFPVVTVSFNLAKGASLSQAIDGVEKAVRDLKMPASVQTDFQGTAAAYKAIGGNEGLLILAALLAVYIVLGVLYESFIHPITILSTLPSAGVGALLALRLFGHDLDIIAVIGIILLIGIVKKNGIMIVDFALDGERNRGLSSVEAIFEASQLRFRPIMMTTLAALFAGIPLALGNGIGSELRRPLGIAMVGGLLVSQALTLYTTPVIYVFFDRLSQRFAHRQTAPSHGAAPEQA